jgi:hypothetical protein
VHRFGKDDFPDNPPFFDSIATVPTKKPIFSKGGNDEICKKDRYNIGGIIFLYWTVGHVGICTTRPVLAT